MAASARDPAAAARSRQDRLELSLAGQRLSEATGPSPTDRGKPGTKRHVVVDRQSTPLGLVPSPANRNDSMMLAATLDAVPPIKGRRGRPRRRPDKLHADKAYDHRFCRRECRQRHIIPRIARRSIDSSEKLGRYRSVAERILASIASGA